MEDLRVLKDLTIHDVQPIGDELTTGRRHSLDWGCRRGLRWRRRAWRSSWSRLGCTARAGSHPGGNPRANLKSIPHRCHPILVAFVWELTKETIDFPLGCLQGGIQVMLCWGCRRGLRWRRRAWRSSWSRLGSTAPAGSRDPSNVLLGLQGCLAHKKPPPPLGPP